jgi:hypothetical protein
MRVQLDDRFIITSDESNFILKEVRISEGEKTKGEIIETPVGYYGNLEHLFDAYLNKTLMKSNATEFAELLMEIRTVKRYIQSLLNLKGLWE